MPAPAESDGREHFAEDYDHYKRFYTEQRELRYDFAARMLHVVRAFKAAGRILDRRYVDSAVAAADAVITKPGYGIVSECLAHRIPVVYTSRGEFAEYGPLVEGLRRYTAATFISNEDLLAGRWEASLRKVVGAPLPGERLEATGAAVAARTLLEAAGLAASVGGARP